MSGTTVTYRNVTLKEVETLAFDQEIQWDESGTDVLYHRFRIRVRSTVHELAATGFHGAYTGQTNPSSATEGMAAIHANLMQPRGSFSYVVDGNVLLQASSVRTDEKRDVNNGPKPIACNITEVFGGKAYRIEFEIEIATVKCASRAGVGANFHGAAARAGNVLNNRWSIMETKDQNFATVRQLQGVLRVSHMEFFPHAYRGLVVPPLARGYRRERQQFADTPDGLTMKYLIVDRQMHAAPPAPATDWEAVSTETTGAGGAMGFTEMRVSLIGPPEVDKQQLLSAAAQVIQQRVGEDVRKTAFQDTGDGNQAVLLHLAVVEHMHAPRIEMAARVQRVSPDQKFLNVPYERIGTPLEHDGYDPKRWPIPKPYDAETPAGIFAKYAQSPCVDVHGVPQVEGLTLQNEQPDNRDDNDNGPPETYEVQEIEEDQDSGVDEDQQQGDAPYTYYQIESKYHTDHGVAHLPIARFNRDAAASADTVSTTLHKGVTTRTVTIHAERVGEWPKFPDRAITSDANDIPMTLLQSDILAEGRKLLPDGVSLLHKAQVRYVYAMERTPTISERLESGSDPRDKSNPDDGVIEEIFDTQGSIL